MDRKHFDRRTYSWSGQSRSYICDFCERGFSNAQALGGHMNIHRKDRAKLRQAVLDDKSSLSLDLNNVEARDDAICMDLTNQNDGSKFVERPFFVDTKYNDTIDRAKALEEGKSFMEDHEDDKKVRTVHEGSSQSREVLDLELRLGLDPYKKSPRTYVER